ncbi:lysM and putative peptidoglycan-binding domain-containing protein 4-like [Carassius carassius]|uniref:lysM and putative peptidoglycan-binding domain-containing protein 4-like n=1 Tax=Carassius carassius TaxID=217509 RepID=UPI002868752C|nr:lysM and putative peptidoglycan-binding domain-containing protein 4-like [Carassius carassius]XP_059420370.1 lysM and putative peptidoglycan-binding domain-containing protein 4-like [Carassius carassius]XP_059420371.1 lysM and putative peptidoglycan-binding domain-containing protein 4-like [Carassius carassius]
MRRGDPLPRAFQAPVDVHASADGQVYMFGYRREEPEESSEDEELNVMELRPRSREWYSQERERAGEMLLLERDISHEDNLSKLAIQYGCKVADIKRVNNLFQEQDMYALRSIRIPVKKHGLLTEANSELRNPQQRPCNDVASSNSAEANISGTPQVQDYTNYLKEVDSDIVRLIQSTDPSEEVLSSSSWISRQWGWRSRHLGSYGADWGIQWWNAVIAMLLIGIVLPIFYVVYLKTQDNGGSAADNIVGNITGNFNTSKSTG